MRRAFAGSLPFAIVTGEVPELYRSPMQKAAEVGVYYRREDYPGFWIRMAIAVIDGIVIYCFWWALWLAIDYVPLEQEIRSKLLAAAIFVFLYIYSIEMKRRCGSVGNLTTRTRVVSLSGGRPSTWSMIVRTSLWVMGPVVLIIDILWVLSDRSRQMIRDRMGSVYVIRRAATPVGTGGIACSTWMFLGYSMLIKEVKIEGGEPGATDNPDDAQRLREDH